MTRKLSTVCAVVVLLLWCLTTAPAQHEGGKHGLGVKQYEDFHKVLHPLEHEALPKGDFARLRSQSALLVKRGNAIVKLGVPNGVTTENRDEFVKELGKFKETLARFRTDAKKSQDDQLKSSYSAVHDSFEMLAGMLPRHQTEFLHSSTRMDLLAVCVVAAGVVLFSGTRFGGYESSQHRTSKNPIAGID